MITSDLAERTSEQRRAGRIDRSCKVAQSPAARRLGLCMPFAIIATSILIATAKAQEAEPRAYSNTPIGLNFLIAGYVYSQGKTAFDPSLSIADAKFRAHSEALAYVRSLDIGGKSAKFDVILPYSSFSASALVAGQPHEREMSGLGDPRFRFSINLFGAPALSVKEFSNYHQDLIVGVSVQASAPLGQYDNRKLLNLGNNRWSFRPELGVSKAWGPWTVEIAPSVTIFTDNTDFFNGSTFAQAPVYVAARPRHLQFSIRHVDVAGWHLFYRRPHHGEWRERGQRTNQHARWLDPCSPGGSAQLHQIQCQRRDYDTHRKRVQRRWDGLAAPLGMMMETKVSGFPCGSSDRCGANNRRHDGPGS